MDAQVVTEPHSTPAPADSWQRPRGRTTAAVYVATVAINCLMLAFPVCVMLVYDRVIPGEGQATLLVLLAGLLAAVLLELVLRLLRGHLVNSHAVVAEHHLTLRAVERLLHATPAALAAMSVSELHERLRNIERLRDYATSNNEYLPVDLAFAALNLVLIALFAGWLVLVPIAAIVMLAAVLRALSARLRDNLEHRVRLENQRQDFLMNTLQSLTMIRSMAVESPSRRRYEAIQSDLDGALENGAGIQAIVQSAGVFASQLVLVLFVAFGAGQVLDESLSLGALAAGTMLAGRVLQPLLAGVVVWVTLQRVRQMQAGLSQLLGLEQQDAPASSAASAPARRGSAALALQSVSFRYAPDAPDLFENLNLDIAPGEVVGLVGDNGSGKSTLLRLLLGLYAPTTGTALVDEQPASAVAPGEVTLLPQDGVLFRGTLIENLTLFHSGAAIRRAARIVDKLGMRETIRRLPLGLDTPLQGGRVSPFPGSFVQQVLIARALGGNPRVILVDEASSPLDSEAERHFKDTLKSFRSRATMVICSNRTSLLRTCDRVLRIEGRTLQDVSEHFRPKARKP